MKLIQARIRGLGATMETRWFDLSPQLNLFHFPDNESGRNFFRALQTINPPYSFQNFKPFADFPPIIKQGKHARRVIAAKRTVALTVFGATPGLVQELALISPLLYEVDRIEVGRRLDYSRWINFVELASSSRWSEVEADIHHLLELCRPFTPKQATTLKDVIKNLKPSDRIKNELQHQLTDLLQEISSKLGDDPKQLIETTLATIYRAEHFKKARSFVGRRLPLFAVLPFLQKAEKTLNHKSTPRSDLLHFAATRAENICKKSAGSEKYFLEEINRQLAQLNFLEKPLQFKKTDNGMSLKFDDTPGQILKTGPLGSLKFLQVEAALAVALSRAIYGTNPILLLDNPEQLFPQKLHVELADFVLTLSKNYQCLYVYSHNSIFAKNVVGRHYNAAALGTRK